MKERFFLRRIARQSSNVIHRHTQVPVFVEAHLADAALAGLYQAAMSARVTFQRVTRKMLSQFWRAVGGHLVQNFGE